MLAAVLLFGGCGLVMLQKKPMTLVRNNGDFNNRCGDSPTPINVFSS